MNKYAYEKHVSQFGTMTPTLNMYSPLMYNICIHKLHEGLLYTDSENLSMLA